MILWLQISANLLYVPGLGRRLTHTNRKIIFKAALYTCSCQGILSGSKLGPHTLALVTLTAVKVANNIPWVNHLKLKKACHEGLSS